MKLKMWGEVLTTQHLTESLEELPPHWNDMTQVEKDSWSRGAWEDMIFNQVANGGFKVVNDDGTDPEE